MKKYNISKLSDRGRTMATTKRAKSNASARKLMEQLTGGPLTFGKVLQGVREGEKMSLEAFAKQLRVSRQNLCTSRRAARV